MRRFKSVYITPLLVILAFLAGTKPANAGFFDWGNVFGALFGSLLGPVGAVAGWLGAFDWAGDLASNTAGAIARVVVSAVVGIINFLLTGIAVVLFAIANWVVELSIAINTTVQDSLVIRNGFNIVLDVANLGLVVAIIVAAFMVMLRRGDASQLLMRFIAVALLINFSFLIVTNFLIKPVNEITIVLHEASNFDVNSFAATFVTPGGISDWGTTFQEVRDQGEVDFASNAWADIGIMLLGVFFYASFIGIGVFVLFAFAAMFFIRYIALGLLIVMMPIAWLTWIFPNLKIAGGSPFSQWWSSFMRWLLFAPIGMFFFFLAIQATTAQDVLSYVTGEGGAIEQIAGGAGNMMMVIGFLVGGLIVANKMSITGAGYAIATGKKMRGWAAKRAKLYGARIASAPIRSEKGRQRLENLQKATGYKRALGARLMGQQLNIAGAKAEKAITEDARRRIKDMPPGRLQQMLPTLHGPELMEALSTLREKDAVSFNIAAKHIRDPKTKQLFDKYGRGKDYEKLEKKAGFNTATIAAFDTNDDAKFEEELEKFRAKFSKQDYKDTNKYIFGKSYDEKDTGGLTKEQHKLLTDISRKVTVKNHAGAIPTILSGLSAGDAKKEWKEISKSLKTLRGDFDTKFPVAVGTKTIDQKIKIVREGLNPSVDRDARLLEEAESLAHVIRQIESGRRNQHLGGAALSDSGAETGPDESEKTT